MASELDGSWSNHSGFLAQRLSEERPQSVHVEPEESFFPVPSTPAGLASLFSVEPLSIGSSYSIHLWEHLWWRHERTDFSQHHGDEITFAFLRRSTTALARLARPCLPELDVDDLIRRTP